MRKFSFNLKFLDRFKKNNSESESFHEEEYEDEQEHQETQDTLQDHDLAHRTSDQQESLNPIPSHRAYAQAEENSTKTRTGLKSNETDSDYSEDNPEDFAEKTLSNFNIEKFRNENKHLINDNLGEDPTDHNMRFTELEPPSKPSLKSRFKINFPKFGENFSKKNLKNKFSRDNTLGKIDKFDWNDFVLKLFSPYTRGKVHGVFIVLLLATFTYLIGKSVALFIGRSTPIVSSVKSNISIPIEKSDNALQDINKISSTNLFNIKETDKQEDKKQLKDITSIICDDAEKPTAEQLKLLDTIVLQDSVKSVASVQVRGASELLNIREGEQVTDNMEVTRINRMKIILKNLTTGECEYVASEDEDTPLSTPMKIFSPQKGKSLFKSTNPSIKNTGNNFKIKRSFRDKMINNMSEVLTQAKAIQITNPDGSLSFKMTEVVPGSIYSQLNIQNDDIITSINGKKIENLNELMTLLGRIKEIDQFQLGLKRDGRNENLDYGFE
jgi:type II secretory pathway component PulC